MDISIILASYNGEKYINDQIRSILVQMAPNDELIITDDHSTDKTKEIIARYQNIDSRVIVTKGPGQGVCKNFEHGLSLASKDIIMFSDQDDVWLPSKLDIIRKKFLPTDKFKLVMHDMYIANNSEIDKKTYKRRSFLIRPRKNGVAHNIVKNGYYGCCISFTQDYKNILLPFPNGLKLYDQWIGCTSELMHNAEFLPEPLIVHRRHGENFSDPLPVFKQLSLRLGLIKFVAISQRRIAKLK